MNKENTSIDFMRLFDILAYQKSKYPQQRALNAFQSGTWKGYSIDDIQKNADALSCWLIDQGLQQGDRVATVPRQGSPTWLIIDFACQQLGLVAVPLHPGSSQDEMEFIMQETQAKLCIAADEGLYYKVLPLKDKLSSLQQVYHLQKNVNGYFAALEIKSFDKTKHDLLKQRRDAVRPDDMLAIMYTSGTSGIPKGVVLSHANVVSNIKSILTLLPLQAGQRVLSFLPFSHIFERSCCFVYICFGLEVYFATSLDTLIHDFRTVKPYLCTTVPRTLEKMYDVLQQQSMERKYFKRKLILWAVAIGKKYKQAGSGGFILRLKLLFAQVLVLNIWRRKLGGKIKDMIVGAAALQPEIARLFSAGGITTLSGYGMTETSPFLSVNRTEPGMNLFGTVGIAVPGVQIKIADPDEKGEGEILVKGPNIMQGYYKRPDLTAEVMTADGWLHTGDVGKMVHHRFLQITDRKKDIFKTSAGKYIAPQPLENHFKNSPFILQCLIIGFNRPWVSAVLVPNFEVLHAWCEAEKIHWTSPKYMVHNIKVIARIQKEIDYLNEQLQSHERIRKFILSDEEWTVESKELTTSFKLKRNDLAEKFETAIDKLYM